MHLPNSHALLPSYIQFPTQDYSTTPLTSTSNPNMEEPKSNSSSPKSRGQLKERAFVKRLQEINAQEAKNRIRIAQGLPLTTDKAEMLQKPPVKEQTKPMEFKLHTQQRAARRAGFNDLVAIKACWLEYQRQRLEKLQKIIEEEEVKMLRKEMVPRAQLMPFFDKPFFPQRSSRPLTVPKEPSFHLLGSNCWRCTTCGGDHYKFHQPLNQTMKPIK